LSQIPNKRLVFTILYGANTASPYQLSRLIIDSTHKYLPNQRIETSKFMIKKEIATHIKKLKAVIGQKHKKNSQQSNLTKIHRSIIFFSSTDKTKKRNFPKKKAIEKLTLQSVERRDFKYGKSFFHSLPVFPFAPVRKSNSTQNPLIFQHKKHTQMK